jgi:outer membrane receptor protein involved in Fe transport
MKTKNIVVVLLFCSIYSGFSQTKNVTISGIIKENTSNIILPFATIQLKNKTTGGEIAGTISNEEGRFSLPNTKSGNYTIEVSLMGFQTNSFTIFVGNLSDFLDLGAIKLSESNTTIEQVTIVSKQNEISNKMDKKTFLVADNISQAGGSVLQTMQNLPGVTVQDGKVLLRGNEKIIVLVDGKQSGLTGFGNQSGLDNIPASAIEKIEIINNPSAKYDANGNGGIINIIYKKNKKEGFNGKIGYTNGLGALWVRKENLPDVRKQYQITPKINPYFSLNYKRKKTNIFLQSDYLYTETLNKNEFTTRTYSDGTIINQQLKRNRNTHFTTTKAGIDFSITDVDLLTFSGLFGTEKIIDNGDEPFFNTDLSVRNRLWQFVEDELKTTVMATALYQHKFKEAGHLYNVGLNYTFHRENEKYFFDNILPSSSSKDAFKLLSDEQVVDFSFDYVKPLKYGKLETGMKFRNRIIPTNMQFFPGINSPLDASAGGKATYKEIIPAVYGNYVFESNKIEAEIGLRVEYVKLNYYVNPNHPIYKSDGYNYTQPFPNVRLAYKINSDNKLSIFYNRRVDRPNEVDIRIFPKYDDAEIIKVGNPALAPQFTNSLELGYKKSWSNGSFYAALYHKFSTGTITRISSVIPNNTLIYAVFQNANKSYNSGVELVLNQEISKQLSMNFSVNTYQNKINGFLVQNKYPLTNSFYIEESKLISGNLKWNTSIKIPKLFDAQLTAIYLAPDLIPQGKIKARYSVDFGIKKAIQKNKGEIFINATDVFNTLKVSKKIQGTSFNYTSTDYNETQVIRIGYSYKF